MFMVFMELINLFILTYNNPICICSSIPDLYSTHTSSGYSPSMSEGTATPNSLIHHHLHPSLHHHISLQNSSSASINKESDNNNGESLVVDGVKMENHHNNHHHHHHHHQQQQHQQQVSHNEGKMKSASENNTTVDGIKNSTSTSDGSYQCQFCDKSFPRLGYLKKHEQVCRLYYYFFLFLLLVSINFWE